MTFVECRGLTRTYTLGERQVTPLQAVDLSIAQGTFLALMGPSGSGKSTLLNLLAGIDRPSAGELRVGGQDLGALSRSELARWRATEVGYIFQLYNLVPVLTAYENVELPLLLHDLSRKERHRRTALALELVGLADRHDHFPRQLSGGQEQRVAIARALVTDPKLILADEPTGDLDRESALAVMALLRDLHRDLQKTLVMVTHDPTTAEYADSILYLEKGRLSEAKGEGARTPAAPEDEPPAAEQEEA